MTDSSSRSFLDGPVARVLALGLAAASVALLLYINRGDIWPSADVASSEDSAYQACVNERHGQIDEMIRDGVVNDSQASLFKSRAEALCRATAPGR